MEADYEQRRSFRPPGTPFEVDHLAEHIFSHLGYTDLQNCCLVSKSWNASASKLVEIHDICRRVQCRWDESEWLWVIDYGQELLDLVRSRSFLYPRSRDSLPSFKFDSSITGTRSASPFDPFFGNEQNTSTYFSSPYDWTVAEFLTNPLISNLVGSVTVVNRDFIDLKAVLKILTELPKLKELKLKFELKSSRGVIEGWDDLECEATSNVQKLELQLVRNDWKANGGFGIYQDCIHALFRICTSLKSLKLVDDNWCQIPFDVNCLVNALKHPDRLEELEMERFPPRSSFLQVSMIKPFLTSFSNLKSLDLFSWGRLSLTDWNNLIVDGFAANLQVLCLSLQHKECPQQLVYCYSMAPGMNSGALKHLILSVTWPESYDRCDWYEEWNLVEGALTLTEARIVYDDNAVVDLRHFKHLSHLTLRVRNKTSLSSALAAAPPAVKHLQITVVPPMLFLKVTDEELKSAVADHFAAAGTLDVLHVRNFCGNDKHLYLREPKKSLHFREHGLRIIGSGSTKRFTGSVSEGPVAPCCQDWLSTYDGFIF